MEKTNMREALFIRPLEILLLALFCAASAAGQGTNTNPVGLPWLFHPQIAGIRVGPHTLVSGQGGNYQSADDYCQMDQLADGHTSVFAPGTLPGQTDYLFFVMTAPQVNEVVDKSTGFRGQVSGTLVLSSPGPIAGQWALDFAPDYGYYPNNKSGASALARIDPPLLPRTDPGSLKIPQPPVRGDHEASPCQRPGRDRVRFAVGGSGLTRA